MLVNLSILEALAIIELAQINKNNRARTASK